MMGRSVLAGSPHRTCPRKVLPVEHGAQPMSVEVPGSAQLAMTWGLVIWAIGSHSKDQSEAWGVRMLGWADRDSPC